MKIAFKSLLGKQTKGLSANNVSQFKQEWEAKYDQWCKRDLSNLRSA
ncbi:hypothetical protein [Candidatus Enterovibrio escicola]|uniref:Uncharacterized protein n=1 Tax=Candidatus Enterovibrio escicola TaxID=1927127 RepID=A0A2A5T1M7_9GAMM|nr:hypothetical protein [Candidatus Enterovibrio escacola]PCS22028.1 hypothetical protein BTN49_2493 [Candidatus Enterovibrio escacola]